MKPVNQWRIGPGSPLKAQAFLYSRNLAKAASTLEDERTKVCSIFVPTLCIHMRDMRLTNIRYARCIDMRLTKIRYGLQLKNF